MTRWKKVICCWSGLIHYHQMISYYVFTEKKKQDLKKLVSPFNFWSYPETSAYLEPSKSPNMHPVFTIQRQVLGWPADRWVQLVLTLIPAKRDTARRGRRALSVLSTRMAVTWSSVTTQASWPNTEIYRSHVYHEHISQLYITNNQKTVGGNHIKDSS